MKNKILITQQFKRINYVLFAIFCLLFTWVVVLFFEKKSVINSFIDQVKETHFIEVFNINQNTSTLTFKKKHNNWQITYPIQQNAANNVIDILLSKLQTECQPIHQNNAWQSIDPSLFDLSLKTNHFFYQISHNNLLANKVYVTKTAHDKTDKALLVCDQIVRTMLTSPAINFIDKTLYNGKLQSIKGHKGTLNQLSGLDLSVYQIIEPTAPPVLSSDQQLTFYSDKNSYTYYLVPIKHDSNHTYLFLFSPERNLIFAIAKQDKINHIIK